MFNFIYSQNKNRQTVLLKMLIIFCLAFSILRLVFTGSAFYFFLIWNLFLAYIPWAVSKYALKRFISLRPKTIIPFLLLIWLLFFPNTLYILTDLFHLGQTTAMPMWFDLILILSFAWTGLVFGFFSLWNIEKIVANYLSPKATAFVSYSLLFIGSFGVYIGRYLRWNSWDLFINPIKLFSSLSEIIFNPLHYPSSWGMTLFFGCFLVLINWSIRMNHTRTE